MKDINKEEVSDFENSWREAFENAEATPTNDIWSAIDAELANQDTQKYKRKTVFYKWVAAASVVFALGLSYFSYTISTSSNQPMLADQNVPNTAIPLKNQNQKEGVAENFSVDTKGNTEKASSTEMTQTEAPVAEQPYSSSALAHASEQGTAGKVEMPKDGKFIDTNHDRVAQGNEPSASGENTSIAMASREPEGTVVKSLDVKHDWETSDKGGDGVAKNETFHVAGGQKLPLMNNNDNAQRADIAQLEGMAYDLRYYAALLSPPYLYAIPGVMVREQKDENEKKVLWAGLNFGSSIFDPNFQQGSNFQPKTSPALSQTFAREAPQAATVKENTDAGVSYSLGLNFGMQVSEKWVIQSGVRYAHKSASTSSTTQLQDNANSFKTPTYLGDMETAVVNKTERNFSQQYDLLNSFEFASIPLKAGYMLIDNKIGVMLTAGIGADIFLSNTISETNDKLEDVTVEAGSDSPFREVNFNGLVGAEVFYKISRQYHLTLEPNYSIALSPFTKSSSAFESHPQTFGVTAGLKFYWK